MGGESRLRVHGVPKVFSETCPVSLLVFALLLMSLVCVEVLACHSLVSE